MRKDSNRSEQITMLTFVQALPAQQIDDHALLCGVPILRILRVDPSFLLGSCSFELLIQSYLSFLHIVSFT